MGIYFRKSISIGPIRLNLSKSGVGASVGVKGLRLGIRPDGSEYVHAGRFGIYFRQELGSAKGSTLSLPGDRPIYSAIGFESVAASEIATTSPSELVDAINLVRHLPRYDWRVRLAAIASTVVLLPTALLVAVSNMSHEWPFYVNFLTLAVPAVICVGLFFVASQTTQWERRRRTLSLNFYLEGRFCLAYETLVSAINRLAVCEQVWRVIGASWNHDPKRNAGSTDQVRRDLVQTGADVPEWIISNIPIPAIRIGNESYFFFPAGILVDDQYDCAFVNYADVSVCEAIEDYAELSGEHPRESTVVRWTWLHPNQDGSPDRRFSQNVQVPYCRYGKLLIHSQRGIALHLLTSSSPAAGLFAEDWRRFRNLATSNVPADSGQAARNTYRSWIEVNAEFAQSFCGFLVNLAAAPKRGVVSAAHRIDSMLNRIAGPENELIYWFLRALSLFALFAILAVVIGLFFW
ncbi:MAG: DUF4236 domain-containing protein [Pirellulales bacterium]